MKSWNLNLPIMQQVIKYDYIVWGVYYAAGKVCYTDTQDYKNGENAGNKVGTAASTTVAAGGLKKLVLSGGDALIRITANGTAEIVQVVSGNAKGAIQAAARLSISPANIGGGDNTPQYKKTKSIKGSKPKHDALSWAKKYRPYTTEDGKAFAKRLCNGKYGAGNYKTGAGSEFSQI